MFIFINNYNYLCKRYEKLTIFIVEKYECLQLLVQFFYLILLTGKSNYILKQTKFMKLILKLDVLKK
jgi:hypothetical protein